MFVNSCPSYVLLVFLQTQPVHICSSMAAIRWALVSLTLYTSVSASADESEKDNTTQLELSFGWTTGSLVFWVLFFAVLFAYPAHIPFVHWESLTKGFQTMKKSLCRPHIFPRWSTQEMLRCEYLQLADSVTVRRHFRSHNKSNRRLISGLQGFVLVAPCDDDKGDAQIRFASMDDHSDQWVACKDLEKLNFERAGARIISEALVILALPLLGMSVAFLALELESWERFPVWPTLFIVAIVVGRICWLDTLLACCASELPQPTSTPELLQPTGTLELSQPMTILSMLGKDFCNIANEFPPPYTISKLEVLDASLDGIAIMKVLFMEFDDAFQARYHLLCHDEFCGFLFFPLSGSMCLVLALAIWCQFAWLVVKVGDWDPDEEYTQDCVTLMAAELSGLGATCKVVEKRTSESIVKNVRILLIGGRTLYEGVFGLFLQSTAVMLCPTSILQQPLLAGSMALSIMSSLKKMFELLSIARAMGFSYAQLANYLAVFTFVVMIGWTVTRLVISDMCPSHLWSEARGCIETPP